MNRKVFLVGLALVVPLLGVLLFGLGRDPNIIASPLVGRPAPSFLLKAVGGAAPISLEGLKGRPVVLNFWATWCMPCIEEHDVLASAARVLGSQVQFLGVVYEDQEEAVQVFLRQHGSAYPSLLDTEGRTAITYGVFGVPETFFIDAQGTVVAKQMGPLSPEALRSQLAKAKGATP